MRAPVLDVGGTHVTAALVDIARWRTVDGTRRRTPLNSDGSAAAIVRSLAAAVLPLGDIGAAVLGVSMPGPFDYAAGIGRFHDVGKFDALNGVDVGAALRSALPVPPASIAFVNDASAFAIGEWVAGAAMGADRAVGITLGTGVGSAFLDHGRTVSAGPSVPPHGYAHLLRIGGRPLEDVVSRRAIVAAYQSATACEAGVDVDVIARYAAGGDAAARRVLDHAMGALGEALRPWLVRFNADVLVVGGGMAASWDLIEPALHASLFRTSGLGGPAWTGGRLARSADTEESNLVGAAWHAANSQTDPSVNRSEQ
jgi:glucokinase